MRLIKGISVEKGSVRNETSTRLIHIKSHPHGEKQ